MCNIAPLLYTTKRCEMATCYMPCYMPSHESDRKHCANQAVFLGPVVGGGGWQHNESALCWQDSGAPGGSSVDQPLWVACRGPARCWTLRVSSRLSAASFRLWQDGQQPSQLIRGRCTACTLWHSAQ